jgi:hypothetical protein
MPRKSSTTTTTNQAKAGPTTRQPRRATRPERREPLRRAPLRDPVEPMTGPALSPSELYQREKARRAHQASAPVDALEEARREFQALLAAEAAAGKGGRPRKNVAKPKPEDAEVGEE